MHNLQEEKQLLCEEIKQLRNLSLEMIAGMKQDSEKSLPSDSQLLHCSSDSSEQIDARKAELIQSEQNNKLVTICAT